MASANMDILLDPRRNQAADRKKLYEEMLLKEMPGINVYYNRINSYSHCTSILQIKVYPMHVYHQL